MQRQLKLKGFNVVTANNGKEGLDVLEKDSHENDERNKIDVVLMDIEMPVMDGLTAVRELRKLEASGAIKRRYAVIAVTGNARQGQVDECLRSGFDLVAIKPYKMEELVEQIDSLTYKDSM